MSKSSVQSEQTGVSKVKLALGAASLFLFVVGIKRSFRAEDGTEVLRNGERLSEPAARSGY